MNHSYYELFSRLRNSPVYKRGSYLQFKRLLNAWENLYFFRSNPYA